MRTGARSAPSTRRGSGIRPDAAVWTFGCSSARSPPISWTMRRSCGGAASGQPTWMKAADAGREYRVGARTLSKKTVESGFELGGLSSIRIRRTLLVRREEIASRWPRRDQLVRTGQGISRKIEHPDSDEPRMGAYAAADGFDSGTERGAGALAGAGRSAAAPATDWPHRNHDGDFPRNPSRRFLRRADAGIDAVVNEGR